MLPEILIKYLQQLAHLINNIVGAALFQLGGVCVSPGYAAALYAGIGCHIYIKGHISHYKGLLRREVIVPEYLQYGIGSRLGMLYIVSSNSILKEVRYLHILQKAVQRG